MARILNPLIDIQLKLFELCESEKISSKKEKTVIGF